jgi:hypothetical protein
MGPRDPDGSGCLELQAGTVDLDYEMQIPVEHGQAGLKMLVIRD